MDNKFNEFFSGCMTVADLIAALQKLDQDKHIFFDGFERGPEPVTEINIQEKYLCYDDEKPFYVIS